EDGIRDFHVTGVQTCALPISPWSARLPLLDQPGLAHRGSQRPTRDALAARGGCGRHMADLPDRLAHGHDRAVRVVRHTHRSVFPLAGHTRVPATCRDRVRRYWSLARAHGIVDAQLHRRVRHPPVSDLFRVLALSPRGLWHLAEVLSFAALRGNHSRCDTHRGVLSFCYEAHG